tara:strand:- start:3538 stop:3915 length:378 start_codon:yes stop_codon:yes gene_type:complete
MEGREGGGGGAIVASSGGGADVTGGGGVPVTLPVSVTFVLFVSTSCPDVGRNSDNTTKHVVMNAKARGFGGRPRDGAIATRLFPRAPVATRKDRAPATDAPPRLILGAAVVGFEKQRLSRHLTTT